MDHVHPPRSNGAGWALRTAERVVVPPRGFTVVRTGLVMAFPLGVCGQIGPLRDSTGCLDIRADAVDFRHQGEVRLVVWNHADAPCVLESGVEIAQIIPTIVHVGDAEYAPGCLDTNAFD